MPKAVGGQHGQDIWQPCRRTVSVNQRCSLKLAGKPAPVARYAHQLDWKVAQ
jgi:hypothetical protein